MKWLRGLLRRAVEAPALEVDLHGLRVPQALAAVAAALREAEERGEETIRIVCGKGRGSPGGVGALRTAVAGWLDAHGYSGRYRREVDRDGRDGALWVDVERATGAPREEA